MCVCVSVCVSIRNGSVLDLIRCSLWCVASFVSTVASGTSSSPFLFFHPIVDTVEKRLSITTSFFCFFKCFSSPFFFGFRTVFFFRVGPSGSAPNIWLKEQQQQQQQQQQRDENIAAPGKRPTSFPVAAHSNENQKKEGDAPNKKEKKKKKTALLSRN